MMKLNKKNLNKLCIITWKDAKGSMGTTLQAFLKEGFITNETVGWLVHYDLDKVVLCTERAKEIDNGDFVLIPRGWISCIEYIEDEEDGK